MKYKYQAGAGFYGNGSWIVYSVDCFGYQVAASFFDTESECTDYIYS